MEPVVLLHTSSSSCFFEIVSLFSLLPYFGKSFGVRSALFRVLSIFFFAFTGGKKPRKKGEIDPSLVSRRLTKKGVFSLV